MRLRSAFASALVIALLATAGCSGSGTESTTTGATPADLERTQLTVGTFAMTDTAPLQLAVERGLFREEGLDVKLQMLTGDTDAVPKLKDGAVDISVGNYVSFFHAAASGTLDLKIVADASRSAPGSHVIMVPKDSTIQTPGDLKGKKIAVSARRNVPTLLVRVAANAYGVELSEERDFVEFPLSEMQAVLRDGRADAAQVIEPFGTLMGQSIGARIIWDTSQGPTNEFPISGYATTADFAADNPKTIAAFQRAMAKAQDLAAVRSNVVEIIPTYTNIKPAVAGSINIVGYPTTVSASRLQRVADSMHEYGLLEAPLNVQDLVIPAR